MKQTINAYFAVLLITIVSSGATLSIVNVGTTQVVAAAMEQSNAQLAALLASMPAHRK